MNKKVLIGIGAAVIVVVIAVLIGTFYAKGPLFKGGGGYGGWGGATPVTPEQPWSPITPEPPPPTFEAQPYTLTTRAQFAAILIRNLTGKKPSELSQYKGCFPDTVGHIYEPYICYSQVNGLVQGFKDGMFKPEQHISRAEGAKYIVKAFGLALYEVKGLADDIQYTWAYVFANTLLRYKIATAYAATGPKGGAKLFYPNDLLTTQTALDWVTKAKAVKK